jgi:hypothetical protein
VFDTKYFTFIAVGFNRRNKTPAELALAKFSHPQPLPASLSL